VNLKKVSTDAMSLADYVKTFYGDNITAFAKANGYERQNASRMIKAGKHYVIGNIIVLAQKELEPVAGYGLIPTKESDHNYEY
jgi:hypothetical protein